MNDVHEIVHDGSLLAIVIRSSSEPQETEFLTPADQNFQVGFIVKDPGQDVPPHTHKPIERHLTGTSEVLMVKSGHCELDLFNGDGRVVESHELGPGDVVVLLGGGHGLRIKERTVFLEVKQGPYPGVDEKDHL